MASSAYLNEPGVFDLRELDASLFSASPLHLVAGSTSPHAFAMLQALLQNDADPNTSTEDGLTPLHIAAQWGQYESLKLLLVNGADPTLRDIFGKNALEYAQENCQFSCASLLDWWLANSAFDSRPTVSSPTHAPADREFQSPTNYLSKTDSPIIRTEHKYVPKYFPSPMKSSPVKGNHARNAKKPRPKKLAFEETFTVSDTSSQDEGVDKVQESFLSIVHEDQEFETRNAAILKEVQEKYDDQKIKETLIACGHDVGPINDRTRWIYERRLAEILSENGKAKESVPNPDLLCYNVELRAALKGQLNCSLEVSNEAAMMHFFEHSKNRKWREGTRRSAFCYILLDSRLTRDLPARAKDTKLFDGENRDAKIFGEFIRSIFYIGKGQKSRPFQHLKDALKVRNGSGSAARQPNGENSPVVTRKVSNCEKIQRILHIWKDGFGVISVHLFQNVIPAEAYTREAAMIDAIGLQNLTNACRGDYYGLPATWSVSKKRKLGLYLLHKAMKVFLAEGERPLLPHDVVCTK